jgi:hypothetical protein
MTVVREEDFADVAEQDVDSLFVGQERFFRDRRIILW